VFISTIALRSSAEALSAAAVCAVLSGSVQAKSHEVTLKISVSTAGLDTSLRAGARELYSRLQKAARVVCGDGNRLQDAAARGIAVPVLVAAK
jgi:UrcA family protein